MHFDCSSTVRIKVAKPPTLKSITEMDNSPSISDESNFSRLGTCQICQKNPSKYTCPGCEVVTCSLPCVNEHKKINECDGIRSKTAFVRLKNFSDLHLLSDYRLLEEAGRCVDRSKRELRGRPLAGAYLPYGLQKIKMALLQRGTRLHFLPRKFIRHESNTTYWEKKTNIIMWRVQLTFLNANKTTFYIDKCSENMVLKDIIEQYLLKSTAIPDKARKNLEAYRVVGLSSIDVLMKAEKIQGSQKKFYKLNMADTLKSNLAGKNVVEFPQIFILIKGFYTSTPDKPREIKLETKSFNLLADSDKLNLESESDGESTAKAQPLPRYKDLLKS